MVKNIVKDISDKKLKIIDFSKIKFDEFSNIENSLLSKYNILKEKLKSNKQIDIPNMSLMNLCS